MPDNIPMPPARVENPLGSLLRSPDFKIATGTVDGLGDMGMLSAMPGTPGYAAKMAVLQKSPEEPSPLILPPQNMPVADTLMGVGADKRVAIYVGRGTDFVVAVEEAPEWDAVDQWKLAPELLLALVPVLRALGVKLSDRSGGEFKQLERDAS